MSTEPAVLPTDASPHVATLPPAAPFSTRFEAIDLLRGAIMVLMVIDHTRDFFGGPTFDPTDLTRSNPALFLTRWVTHFCAPGFAFLAGMGAYLAGIRGRSRGGLAAFLASRGLWLIFLEVTAVNFAVQLNPASRMVFLVVFWSIGASFVLLAPLVFLPSRLVGVLGVFLIATHHLLAQWVDGPLAVLLFRRGPIELPGGMQLIVGYPLIPWFGVVAAGYGFGEVVRLEPHRRRLVMAIAGLGLTAAFVALRAWGGYGEPSAWSSQKTPLLTALEFVNCTKNPPSLLFVLMTLGPLIAFMAVLDRVGVRGAIGRAVLTLGRVPLFFFLLHLYVIHGLGVLTPLVWGFVNARLFPGSVPLESPPGWPLGLTGVYAVWVVMLVILYPPSRWFAGVKARHREGWLSYL
jgi:uncharacterized membrane protein